MAVEAGAILNWKGRAWMVFSSTEFLFAFLPAVWLINRFLPLRASNWFLVFSSLFFYAWGEPVYVLLMVFSVLLNFTMSLLLVRQPARKKLWLVAAVVLNLLLLGVFKYANMVVETISALFSLQIQWKAIALPIGISFFTFQALSYTIDVARGVTPAQHNLLKLLLYISFFPQLIAGPIVKYHDIAEQIDSRRITLTDTFLGVRRFLVGLSKKMLLANTLAVTADAVYALSPDALSAPIAWLGAVCYALQIYFDFSGYSDMAIGMGHMFGFTFLENFRYPYISASVQEFWRRWHISLSTWFKEYVYIPLGGNRKGLWRTCINRLIVFFLTGLWHGAQWTFVAWGLFHGVFLLLEAVGALPVNKLRGKAKLVGVAYTLLVAVCGFVLFRAESFAQAMAMLGAMFTGGGNPPAGELLKLCAGTTLPVLAISIVGCTPWLPALQRKIAGTRWEGALSIAASIGTLVLLFLCILCLSAQTHNPFIYFRF